MDLDDEELEFTRRAKGLIKHEIYILNRKIRYDKNNIKIINSYKTTNILTMTYILLEFLNRTGYKSKRTVNSWLREWKAHNRLYRLGLFKSHTKDCDLEENEKWYRLLIYQIIGRF